MTELKDAETVETFPAPVDPQPEFEDITIHCIDCAADFVWSIGEQAFFRDKHLRNPPKRCKECKKAKNQRLEAIEVAKITGKRQRIEVRAECARCSVVSTVPFYPCQGRPVYCRACYATMKDVAAHSAVGRV